VVHYYNQPLKQLPTTAFSGKKKSTKIIELQEKLIAKHEEDMTKISDSQLKLDMKKNDEIGTV